MANGCFIESKWFKMVKMKCHWTERRGAAIRTTLNSITSQTTMGDREAGKTILISAFASYYSDVGVGVGVDVCDGNIDDDNDNDKNHDN